MIAFQSNSQLPEALTVRLELMAKVQLRFARVLIQRTLRNRCGARKRDQSLTKTRTLAVPNAHVSQKVPNGSETAATISTKANTGVGASVEAFAQMARRRFQNPVPTRRGAWWTLRVRQDRFDRGKHVRVLKRIKLAPAAMNEREVRKIAAEYVRPMNQGMETIGSATNFRHYVTETYTPLVMPLLAKTTQDRYEGVLDNYLVPAFGELCLREITPMMTQRYFSQMATSRLSYESKDKIRDVLASVMGSAVRYGLLTQNPVENVKLPPDRRGSRRSKPYITPEQFDRLVADIAEPYATMVYVAIYTGLRVSELAALKWNDVGEDSITVDERYCRGDWSQPKSDSSNATIGVDTSVIERIHSLKSLTITVRAGRATRRYKAVKSATPDDLVFQSVRDGKPIRDNNILVRFIKPAGRRNGFGYVNWRSLRTSRATWMIEAGANPKDVQGQMRHSRIQTTLDIYAQFVPESQRRAVEATSRMVAARIAAARAAKSGEKTAQMGVN